MPSVEALGFNYLGAQSKLYEAESHQKAICAELNGVQNSHGGLRSQLDLRARLTEATAKVAEEFSRGFGPGLAEKDVGYCFSSEGSGNSDCVAVMAFGRSDWVRKRLEFPLALGFLGNVTSYKDLQGPSERAKWDEFSREQVDTYKHHFSGSGTVFYSVAPDRHAVFALGDKKVMDRLKADFVAPSSVDADLINSIEQLRHEFWTREQALHDGYGLSNGSQQ